MKTTEQKRTEMVNFHELRLKECAELAGHHGLRMAVLECLPGECVEALYGNFQTMLQDFAQERANLALVNAGAVEAKKQ